MDAITLELERHRFASIAEEMGVVLMRSAFSPNIKERRDYSCAIFDAAGEMVAQAAHIPVHLGSAPMSVAAALAAGPLKPGQHIILNDPYAGGTHLPDITLVSPVFDGAGELAFVVANRAHHADVGGRWPGSMGLSEHIDEEGIRLGPTVLSEAVIEAITRASRTSEERRGDLQAQLAANLRGVARLQSELEGRGHAVLDACRALQAHSERFMREVLREVGDGRWSFEDALDDDGLGSGPIPIRCELSIEDGRATVDLRGSASAVRGPLNVPRAVAVSAALYCFRCLAPAELPSNGGYMRCVEVLTEAGTVVDAAYPAAVALGNVETSQRIVDVIFGALARALPGRIPAASCGSMNNLTIGGTDPRHGGRPFAYYETIAGGAGAGPGGPGQSAVHTHMTNTLNTPVEALEHAYPIRMVRYARRVGSGGAGRHRGGDGVVREMIFEAPATVSVMAERRVFAPYGLAGGAPGARGSTRLIRARGGQEERLEGKISVEVEAGDRLIIETPGGGGYGAPEETDAESA
ncbi:hydantoinase B/oxoprolinase family protein [Lujinxingia vulgaris]|uniref:Hydantoinase B/oxoprolinase family protein n=1 Tax=Lujinxingia vulgaris TaxID=2600176 RepID=A0A5C6X9X5_9DELT|nr:hydantoinase B/oxoprolinase family protein [Lujinxingia vulgaris]TXD38641.1 hydantoinase B/oxoprolinase family protein [Lujinxingia vulgaris]